MRRLLPILIATAAMAVCASAALAASGSAQSIHERFTALPCTSSRPKTTLGMEGCAEHAVLAIDARIDALYRTIDAKLPAVGRAAFTTASADWLGFRNAQCQAEASPNAGGSIANVLFLDCAEQLDSSHLADLRALARGLSEPR